MQSEVSSSLLSKTGIIFMIGVKKRNQSFVLSRFLKESFETTESLHDPVVE